MALKDTCKKLKTLLDEINQDMPKAEAGNKAAAQRVRKHTIAFAKVAKVFRKESVKAASGEKKAATKRKAPAKSKVASKKPVAKKATKARKPATKKRVTKRRVARKAK